MKNNDFTTILNQSDMEIPPREGVIFYERFFRAIQMLPMRIRLLAYETLLKYAFYDELPAEEIPKSIKQLFLLAQPQFDANERKRRNGFKGKVHGIKGAESGKKGGRPKKEYT